MNKYNVSIVFDQNQITASNYTALDLRLRLSTQFEANPKCVPTSNF